MPQIAKIYANQNYANQMKKLFPILLLISANSFASGQKCYHQRNPIGYANYDICEVEGTGYTCVSLEGKVNSSISCFPTLVPQEHEDGDAKEKVRFIDRKSW